MSSLEREIGLLIQEIAKKAFNKMLLVMSGKVVPGSLNESDGTVSVVLSINSADAPTEGVLISGVTDNDNGFILYPADGSDVWVALIDGQGKYGIIKCSTLAKANVTIGEQTYVIDKDGHVFNGGNNGGVPIAAKVNENDDTLKKYCEALNNAVVAGLTAVGAGGAANGATGATAFQQAMATQQIVFKEIEDNKVKH